MAVVIKFRLWLLSTVANDSTRVCVRSPQTEESRVILHFHYTRWPDFGVPKTPDVFLDFLYAVRSSGVLSEDVGPCVIHCRSVCLSVYI